jgi:tetratricopeptide (TPR) repeat protein
MEVSTSLLVEYFNQLPERRAKENAAEWRTRRESAKEVFRKRVSERYTEGTLLRLLDSADALSRRAALLALSLVGTMAANAAVAACLHDGEADVRQMAVDTLWTLWFRADSEENNAELQRLARTRDRERALAGLDQLIKRAPVFAEAFNQRAIVGFSLKQYERSITDCEKALQLNPYHFGAQAGMAQSFLQMRKHKAALKGFRAALRINPHLDGVADTIRALETALGEEGRKDDKK